MFVSSYSTYIPNESTNKTTRINKEDTKTEKSSFSSHLSSLSTQDVVATDNLPINYVSTNQTFRNKQELDYQKSELETKEKDTTKQLTTKFTQQSTLIDATTAYTTNTKPYSFLQKPKATLSQTPTINTTHSKEYQDLEEKNLRHTMVNTYIENDKYYKITA